MMFLDVRGVSDCAGSPEDFVLTPPFVWSSPFVIGSTPWRFSFTAQYPACPCPCLRFASRLATDGARLGVRMGHYSFPVRLFHSRHHAGLSRRTTKPFRPPNRPSDQRSFPALPTEAGGTPSQHRNCGDARHPEQSEGSAVLPPKSRFLACARNDKGRPCDRRQLVRRRRRTGRW